VTRHIQQWKELLILACLAALLPAPFLAYNFLEFNLDPFLKAWTEQNRILSPHPVHYLLAYGLLLPFAFFGAWRLLCRRPWEGLMLVPWVLSLPLLAYAPVAIQRRLPEGIWIALVVLSLSALEELRTRWRKTNQRAKEGWLSFPLLLAYPSTLILLVGGFLTAIRPALPVFRPAAEITAFQSLQEQARPAEVVLTSFESGNPLPAWAPLRVVIGHGPESANLSRLRPLVSAFYSVGATDFDRLEFLRKENVNYVFYGPAERSLGSWDPSQAAFLRQVYDDGINQIYKVSDQSVQ
jgi:hypothetical protein